MDLDADPFVRARQICEVMGVCRRSLYDFVKRGDFPPPDRPQRKRGEPDLWRLSSARRGIKRYSAPRRGGKHRPPAAAAL